MQVLENVGLCIKLYDILDVGDGIIMAGDGGRYIKKNITNYSMQTKQ
jgi:DNA-directed RNA polymerase subunit E'/Rpb7